VSALDHLASGIVPLVALGLLGALAPRLRAGLLAALSGLLGLAVAIGCGGGPVAAVLRGGIGPAGLTGVAAMIAGLTLMAAGAVVAHRHRRREAPSRRRRFRRAGLAVAMTLAAVLGAAPLGMGYVVGTGRDRCAPWPIWGRPTRTYRFAPTTGWRSTRPTFLPGTALR
jgi:hypothetical protein